MSTLIHTRDVVGTTEAPASGGPTAGRSHGDSTVYEVVTSLVAAVLLIAAALKLRQMLSLGYGYAVESHGEIVVEAMALAAEWLVGTWLVSGIARVWARRANVVLLGILLAVATTRLVRGASDCGCFGTLHVPPSSTVTFDAAAIFSLLVVGGRSTVGRNSGANCPTRLGRLLVAGLLAAGFPLVAAVGSATRYARAQSVSGLYCDSPSFDFGSVQAMNGSALAHDFVLSNVSRHPITIASVATSCGCTTAALPTTTVQPGASVAVPVRVAWGGRFGPQSAAVTIVTANGTAESELRLTVTASLQASALVWPHDLFFSDLIPGSSTEQYFEVSRAPDRPRFTVTGVRTSSPSIVVRRADFASGAGAVPEEPGRFAVSVVSPRFRFQSLGWIIVSTSDGSMHLINVHVRAAGALAASPESLLFHNDSHSAPSLTLRILLLPTANVDSLRTQIVTNGDPPAFVIQSIAASAIGDRPAGIVTVRHTGSPRTTAQTLRIMCGNDSLDVPLVMIASSEKEPRGPMAAQGISKGEVP